MISGAHDRLRKDAEADRAFFRDVLGFESVDADHGWLIFAMPPAEAAFHPSDANDVHELYFMCEDLKAEMAAPRRERRPLFRCARSPMGFDYQNPASRGARSVSTSRSTRPRSGSI